MRAMAPNARTARMFGVAQRFDQYDLIAGCQRGN
jgi:hypothetical protein